MSTYKNHHELNSEDIKEFLGENSTKEDITNTLSVLKPKMITTAEIIYDAFFFLQSQSKIENKSLKITNDVKLESFQFADLLNIQAL